MRPVLATAMNLLRELLRKRTCALFLLLIAGCALTLPHVADEGGSLRSRLQLTANYGIGFPVFLIAVATIVVAAGSVSRDVESQRIQPVVTKSCARWQTLLGRLVGILTVDALLLSFVLLLFVVNTWIAERDAGAALRERDLAEQRFYTPRVPIRPMVPSIGEEEIRQYLDRLGVEPDAAGGLTRDELDRVARRLLRSARIPPGDSADLELPEESMPRLRAAAGKGARLFVSYVLHWSPPGGAPQAACRWEVRNRPTGAPESTTFSAVEQRISMGTPHEFSFRGDLLPDDRCVLTLHNTGGEESGRTLILDPLQVEVLAPYGDFSMAVARSALLLMTQFALLAALGLLGSSVFSAATAYLLGFFFYATSLSSSFLLETFEKQSVAAPQRFTDWIGTVLSEFGQKVLALLPDLGSADPVGNISMGRTITWSGLCGEAAWTLGVQGALIFLLAVWLLSRREIAKGAR